MKQSWLIGSVVGVSCAVATVLLLMYILPIDFSESSPVQPIIFSHKLRAASNGIPCLYCHRYASVSRLAGIPSVADCRACHLYISTESPEIKKLNAGAAEPLSAKGELVTADHPQGSYRRDLVGI